MVEEQIQNAEMNLQRLDVELSQIPSDPQMTKTLVFLLLLKDDVITFRQWLYLRDRNIFQVI